MTSIRSLYSLTLDLPPSCIEFSRVHPEYLVVGTYFLEQQGSLVAQEDDGDGNEQEKAETAGQSAAEPRGKVPQQRSGSLILYQIRNDSRGGEKLIHIQTLATSAAVLDIHFKDDVLGAVTSDGCISFCRLSTPASIGHPQLEGLEMYRCFSPETLVLSFAWHPTLPNVIGVTLSTGEVKLCKLSYDGPAAVPSINHEASDTVVDIHSHDLEAWTLAFQPSADGVLSGGDDATLKYSGVPALEDNLTGEQSWLSDSFDSGEAALQWQNKKIHGAGVTAILPLSEDVVVTGSYDDHIRVLSLPKAGKKDVLAEMDLGGGVWRLTVVERQPCGLDQGSYLKFVLLASCMHAGARVVQITRTESGTWDIEVLARFEEHKSMNYGSDVCPSERGLDDGRLFVSTSFYDKLVCLWRYGKPES